ncbi:MAG: diacylglycerol kinase family lipid kinase [Thermoleophilaceae bacterium]|nr:diacylglycerol kinase family lipid kinase [Thermoleophilaceae bacterium]
MSRRFALLVNPASAGGKALQALPEVRAAFDALGASHRTVTTRSIEHAGEEAGRAAERGETVAALGGDGLLRPLAGALRDRDAALALIPCGRGNDLARVLEIPRDVRRAVRIAVEGDERLVDVASVNGRPYMGIASLGFDSEANRLANEARLIRGDAVYLYAALRALAAWKPAAFRVTVDGERHDVTGYSVAVANSQAYGGGMFLLPHAELDDGRLDVLLTRQCSKLTFLRTLPKVFKGTHLASPYIQTLRGEVVEVSSDRPFAVYADGDPIGATPATMRVERRCLRVIAPRAAR